MPKVTQPVSTTRTEPGPDSQPRVLSPAPLTSSQLPWPRVLLGTPSPGLSAVTMSPSSHQSPPPRAQLRAAAPSQAPLQPPSLSPRPFAPAAPRHADTGSGTHRRSGRAGPQGHQDHPWGPRREQWPLNPMLCPSPHEAPRAWLGGLLFSQYPSPCFLPHSRPPADSANPGLRFDLQTSWGRKAVSTTVVTKRPVIYSAGKCWLFPRDGFGPSWLKAEIY